MGVKVEFGYIETKWNPADIGTRGASAQEILSHVWWRGYPLKRILDGRFASNFFSLSKELEGEEETECVSPVYAMKTREGRVEDILDLARYSSVTKSLRVLAYVIRFLKSITSRLDNALQSKLRNNLPCLNDPNQEQYLTASDIRNAHDVLIRNHQAVHISPQYKKALSKTLNMKEDKKQIMASQRRDDEFSKKRRAEEHKLIEEIRRKRACVRKMQVFPSEEIIQSKIRNFVKSIVLIVTSSCLSDKHAHIRGNKPQYLAHMRAALYKAHLENIYSETCHVMERIRNLAEGLSMAYELYGLLAFSDEELRDSREIFFGQDEQGVTLEPSFTANFIHKEIEFLEDLKRQIWNEITEAKLQEENENHVNAFENIREMILEMRQDFEEKHTKVQQEINEQSEKIKEIFKRLEEISNAMKEQSQARPDDKQPTKEDENELRQSVNLERAEEDLLDIPEEDELEKYGYYSQSIRSSPATSFGDEQSAKSSPAISDDELEKYGYYNQSTSCIFWRRAIGKIEPGYIDDELEKYGYYDESTRSSPNTSDDEQSMKERSYPGSQRRNKLEQRGDWINSYLKTMANVPERRINRIDQMRSKDRFLVCSFCLEKGLHYSDSCPSYVSVKSRKRRVRCQQCLDSRHNTEECRNTKKRCRYCGSKDHDKALCVLPEDIDDYYRELDEIRRELESLPDYYGPHNPPEPQ
ncbi:hypothetical protein OSTOST_15519 [Ostertagia ostertagi]